MNAKASFSSSSSRAPKHRVVLNTLRFAIESGKYASGDRLPDERQLAEEFQVSRTTVRQALAELFKEGMVERLQGSGTYVRQRGEHKPAVSHRPSSSAGRQMIAVLAVGHYARFSPYVAGILAFAERSVSQRNMHLVVRYVDDRKELPQIIDEISKDPATLGAMAVGQLLEADAALMFEACIPWVVVGDFEDASRNAPIIDQVTGDNYHLAELATQRLLEQGCIRPALMVANPGIWRDEKTSAFRMACYSQGVPAEDQIIAELIPQDAYEHNASAYYQAMRQRAKQLLDQWDRTNRWPDGLIIPGQALIVWLDQVNLHPRASQLATCPVVALDLGHHGPGLRDSFSHPNLSWCEMGNAAVAEQAVYRLLVNPRLGRSALRDYIRDIQIIKPSESPVSASAVHPMRAETV